MVNGDAHQSSEPWRKKMDPLKKSFNGGYAELGSAVGGLKQWTVGYQLMLLAGSPAYLERW